MPSSVRSGTSDARRRDPTVAVHEDPPVGVLVTPVHPQAPDAEAALRLLEGVVELYDLDVDTGPLETFAGEVRGYYGELAARLEEQAESDRPGDRLYT